MASGIFALLDDITVLMDDVAAMSKVATKKTAGIIGDDLAVNAEKATGFDSSRELPVLWKIAVGSFINKLIILPIVFLLNYFVPFLVILILIAGGLFLAYEGALNVYEALFVSKKKSESSKVVDSANEKQKINSAIRTDFILSLEIVIIALGTVLEKSLQIQILTVSVVAIAATVGVYGLVALLIRMDEFGFALITASKGRRWVYLIGNFFVRLLPVIIRLLKVAGTLALIAVAGGIFVHNIEFVHHHIDALPTLAGEFLVGLITGVLILGLKLVTKPVWQGLKSR